MLHRTLHHLVAQWVWHYLSRAFLIMEMIQICYCQTEWQWEKWWRPSRGLNQNFYWNSKPDNVIVCWFSVLCYTQHVFGSVTVISRGKGNTSQIFGHVALICMRLRFIIIYKRKHQDVEIILSLSQSSYNQQGKRKLYTHYPPLNN